jgi:hypothetical protein
MPLMRICLLASFSYVTTEYYKSVYIHMSLMSIQIVCTFLETHCILLLVLRSWYIDESFETLFKKFVTVAGFTYDNAT